MTFEAHTQSGDSCRLQFQLKVEVPKLECALVQVSSPEQIPKNSEVSKIWVSATQKVILKPVVHHPYRETLQSWIENEDGDRLADIHLGKLESKLITLAPFSKEGRIYLRAQDSTGRSCSTALDIVHRTDTVFSSAEDLRNKGRVNWLPNTPARIGRLGAGFAYYPQWGGWGRFIPNTDIYLLQRLSNTPFLMGGELNFQWRNSYLFRALKLRIGGIGALSWGAIAVTTGVGLGHAQMLEIDAFFNEESLYDDNHVYAYWRNDIILKINPEIMVWVGFTPRKHFSSSLSDSTLFDLNTVYLGLNIHNIQFRFERNKIQSQQVWSGVLNVGVGKFE